MTAEGVALQPPRVLRPWWVLVPLLSIGMAAFATFLYLVVRRRTPGRVAVLAVYLALEVLAFALVGINSTGDAGGGVLILLLVGGTAHTCALTARREIDIAAPSSALDRARHDEALRARARALAVHDPRLAIEAHVGRPDVPDHDDDGGLVDVNHASATAVASLPGVSSELAERIVATRASIGRFSSLSDLCVALDLAPQQFDEAADQMLFLVPPPAS